MTDRGYAAQELLVAPCRSRSEFWRLVIGLIMIWLLTFAMGRMLAGGVALFAPDITFDDRSQGGPVGETPGKLLFMLYSYSLLTGAVALTLWLLHGRRLVTAIGPVSLTIRQFWHVLRVLLLVGLASVSLQILIGAVLPMAPPAESPPPELRANTPPGLWLSLLPLSLLGLLIQTSSEEILFRGYIQQNLAARFASPWVWMALPSALFALGHYMPMDAGENAAIVAIWAGLFGLVTADLTARAGTLGPAIALHMVNNFSAILLVSLPDMMSGLSLATTSQSLKDVENINSFLMPDFAMLGIAWLSARVALRR